LSKRILWPQNSPSLVIKNHTTDLQPIVKKHDKYTEYWWIKKKIPIDAYEPYTPITHDVDPWIEISTDLNWRDINLSMSEHYKLQELSPSIKKYVDRIKSSEEDLSEYFIKVMRFIQDEIRYMGTDDRVDGYKPLNAELTYQRRFGDCKDKTYLAITMLKALGIEAYPAVVHTRYGEILDTYLPNPAIFNHVIVVAIINAKTYWIDPTNLLQGGTLENYVQPDYGFALILDGKSKNLVKMPTFALTKPSIYVNETFDLSKGPGNPGSLSIRTVFKSINADFQRQKLQTSTEKDRQMGYLEFVKSVYPSAFLKNMPNVVDDRKTNTISITEEYEIPELWQQEEGGKSLVMSTYADEFERYLGNYKIFADRKNPVATFFPKYVAKIIKIIFSTESDLKNENEIILDPSFEFKRKIKSKGRSCSISYIYKSLSSRVEQSMISTYIKNSNKARDLLKFTICEHDNSSFNKISENTDMLNWPIFLLLVIAFLVYMHFARKIYINQSEVSFEKNENSKLYGIKGWLFLLSFSVILSSFQIIIDAYQTASLILSHNSWLELSSNTNNNPFSLPFIFLEAITNIGLFVLWPLMSLLLLKKKPLFPRLFVYLLFLNLVILEPVFTVSQICPILKRSN
jgi:hypothetical protein